MPLGPLFLARLYRPQASATVRAVRSPRPCSPEPPAATGAASALQAAGLVLGSQGIAIDYTCLNIGRVIRQSPVTGTTVNVGTPVAIWIGRRSPLACP